MSYFVIKVLVSAAIIALVSEIARRAPALGEMIASLPLISILAMIWLWRDTGDTANIAAHAEATFWFVLPSLPMFLLVPAGSCDAPQRNRLLDSPADGLCHHRRPVRIARLGRPADRLSSLTAAIDPSSVIS